MEKTLKVNIEVQVLCIDKSQFRGIPYYALELLKKLVERGRNEYSVSFFDYKKERGNRKFIEEHLSDIWDQIEVFECNDFDYRNFIEGQRQNNSSLYDKLSYEEMIGCDADVYFFPDVTRMPWNVPKGKTVVTAHDVIPLLENVNNNLSADFKKRFRNAIEFLACRKDIIVVTDSESSKNDLNLVGRIDDSRIKTIPISYSTNAIYPEENRSIATKYKIKSPFIYYAGALAPHKGVQVLIEAFSGLRNTNVSLVLSGGEVPELDINSCISDSSAANRIIRTGYVSDVEKRILMSMADIFVFPSYYEGFGLPVLEAMACGTSVITTNISSLPEVGGDAVLYVEPNDVGALTETIDRLLGSESLRAEYASRGLARAKQFSWDKTAELTEQVYTKFV